MSKMPILQICLTKSGYGVYFHFWLLLLIVNTLIDGFADKKTETFYQEEGSRLSPGLRALRHASSTSWMRRQIFATCLVPVTD